MKMPNLTVLLSVLVLAALPALAADPAIPNPADAALLEAVPSDAAPSADAEAVVEPSIAELANELVDPTVEIVHAGGYSFPSCTVVHGTPCQAGATARCQWTPYEPELCWCTSGTFQCGNLP
ncbi:MAG: hypothetical protein AAGC60_24360 [Acidobacteriota bacterium]